MPKQSSPNRPSPKQAPKDSNYSWKGSPNAGKVLTAAAVALALLLFLAGFAS